MIHPPADRNQEQDLPHLLSQENNPTSHTGDDRFVPLDDGMARRIAFTTPISPARM